MIETATPTATVTPGLTDRAIAAAHAYRAADPTGFEHRHDDYERWGRWVRRCRAARTIAAALQVPVPWVTVTDDPDRIYHAAGNATPGDLITITEPLTGRTWQFIPDFMTSGDGWLLIDRCPGCDADIPITPIASLADLGEYLDPDGDRRPPEDGHPGPSHQPDCPFKIYEH
jgi:hypothetical protein